MRNPAQLGKVIATIDNIAGGRIIPGFGGGWMPREFTDFGMPFLSTGKRLTQLRETVELLNKMWDPDEGEVTYNGKEVSAENVVTLPKPPRKPPVADRWRWRKSDSRASSPNTVTSGTTPPATRASSNRRRPSFASTSPTLAATPRKCGSASSAS